MTVEKRFRISLDIKRSTSNRDFEVVEGDNGNLLEVTLTDDGVPVDLTGCRVSAIFSKSDGHTAEQNTDGSGITLDPQQKDRLVIQLYNTSVAPGLVECELQVFSGEGYGTLVTSAKFNFMCRRGIANADTIKSTDEWPLLTGLIQQVRQMEEQTKVLNTATAEAAGAANAAAGTARELQQAVSLAELERREQEEARILNETARDVAEEDRELAEQERQELSSVATMAANTAAEQAKTAADRANAAAEAAEDIVIGALPKHANTHAAHGTDPIAPRMIGAASNRNLLDNWDFRNPVNQRGQTEYSVTNDETAALYKYGIDRWQMYMYNACSLKVENGYLHLSRTDGSYLNLRQRFEREKGALFAGRPATLSFLVDTPNRLQIYFTRYLQDNSAESVPILDEKEVTSEKRIISGTFTLREGETLLGVVIRPSQDAQDIPFDYKVIAAKLEFGDTQTLAYQDAAGEWIIIDPPMDAATELLKCQRYFYRLRSQTSSFLFLGTVFAQSAATCYLTYPLPVEMRIEPTAQYSDVGLFAITRRDSLIENERNPLSELVIVAPNKRDARIRFVSASGSPYTVDNVYNAWLLDGAYIDFSADL